MRIPLMRSIPVVLAAAGGLLLTNSGAAAASSFIGAFDHVATLGSTVPGNGDVNPYGVAVVPQTEGRLVAGDTLISNFNNKANLQGTGRTIVQMSPSGQRSLFATLKPGALGGPCPGGVGLTTALAVLRSGWVIVGSLPTSDGSSGTARAGCLIVINSSGLAVETISGSPINGPWDMTALDSGGSASLFVTNVLNGTVAHSPNTVNRGTVVRIGLAIPASGKPSVTSTTVIGTGLPERTDPAALVVGPTGVGLSGTTLYVANSAANDIVSIGNAVARTTPSSADVVSAGRDLNDPLGLAVAPNGDVLTTNGGDGNLVETTPSGNQIALKMLDTTPVPPGLNGNGTLFGLAVVPDGSGVYFVDDGSNDFNLLHD